MGLLNKDKNSDEQVSLEQFTELQETNTAITTELATAKATIEANAAELKELREFKTQTEQVKSLSAKAAELGFTGNVEQLLIENEFNMEASLGAMITGFKAEVDGRIEDLNDSGSDEDEGDAADDDATFTPKTQMEAIQHVRQEFDLQGKAAHKKAREMYSKLWEV